jgi:3-phosphoshikimate 1-carboxyvinyltransferase
VPSTPADPWPAPLARAPLRAPVTVPGSKSETNRALVLAALADGPSVISNGLHARDTVLMREALRALGVRVVEEDGRWTVTPPAQLTGGTAIDCGLAGTVMRFVPALAALAAGPVHFFGDEQAQARPMAPLLDALRALGVSVDAGGGTGLPFTVTGDPGLAGGSVTVDASTSSQYVSALLLAGARMRDGLEVRHAGSALPSLPHIAMTVAMLRARGVEVDDTQPDRWRVAPGSIRALDVVVEPDLSNAAPFLAAAAVTGGTVTVRPWPTQSLQPGDQIRDVLAAFGADVEGGDGALTVHGRDVLHGIQVDLRAASELTPVVAAVAALAEGTTRINGVGHVRGHETDRLAALEAELRAVGCRADADDDGLTVHPRLLGGALWHTYADHRMAQAGALLGLVVPDVELDDVRCTDKTMPEFVELWRAMLAQTEDAVTEPVESQR